MIDMFFKSEIAPIIKTERFDYCLLLKGPRYGLILIGAEDPEGETIGRIYHGDKLEVRADGMILTEDGEGVLPLTGAVGEFEFKVKTGFARYIIIRDTDDGGKIFVSCKPFDGREYEQSGDALVFLPDGTMALVAHGEAVLVTKKVAGIIE